MPLARIILAAGESTRMGSPKALLPYRGATFLEHLLQVTKHPKISHTRIVLGAHAEQIRAQISLPTDSIVINENWKQGQLSSIHAALRSLESTPTDGILLCPVDTPLFSESLVSELIEKFYESGKLIVLPTYQRKRGHPVIFSSLLYSELLAAPIETGARSVVWAHSSDVLEIPTTEEGVMLNLNDPKTFRRTISS
ncbi:MAG: nucleotidyltransferase family protein [Acidobacteria bacterium]|nr:nucleotidyltransferase family protein [Acidobacteriota bacterium]